MKNLYKILIICCSLFLFSCSQETLEDLENIEEDSINTPGDETDDEDSSDEDSVNDEIEDYDDDFISDDPDNTETTPCDFDFSNVTSGAVIVLNCILDLNGESFDIPSDVDINFQGGDIINGTLNFPETTTTPIDGRILNSSLTINGNVVLKDNAFDFYASRWGIIEGDVTKEEANNNRIIMQSIIDMAVSYGADTFQIGKMDAYFLSDSRFKHPAKLPSNFHLRMSADTTWRVYPDASQTFSTILIKIEEVSNVTVSGGRLIGDRDLRADNPTGDGFLIKVESGWDSRIEFMHLSYASSDGISIFSSKHAWEADYVPSRNMVVADCIFDLNRRNNFSVTDAVDTVVERCEFYRGGVATSASEGVAPRCGIVVEPFVQDSANPYQLVEGVIIRDCIERESYANAFVAADGDDITITGNDFEKPTSYTAASRVKIIDNPSLGAIVAGYKSSYSIIRNEGSIVSGNTVRDQAVGIRVVNQDVQVFDNTILDCAVGIFLDALSDSDIYNNEIINNNGEEADGINAIDRVSNVSIRNNYIEVDDKAFFFDNVNLGDDEQSNTFTVEDNTVSSEGFAIFRATFGLQFINNEEYNSGLRLDYVQNALVEGNIMKASRPFTFELSSEASDNITINNNIIENDDPNGLGPGILAESSGGDDKNIKITNNEIHVKGYNNAVRVDGYNGVTITGNFGTVEQRSLIYYRGNNATITNNTITAEGVSIEHDIEGSNNTTD